MSVLRRNFALQPIVTTYLSHSLLLKLTVAETGCNVANLISYFTLLGIELISIHKISHTMPMILKNGKSPHTFTLIGLHNIATGHLASEKSLHREIICILTILLPMPPPPPSTAFLEVEVLREWEWIWLRRPLHLQLEGCMQWIEQAAIADEAYHVGNFLECLLCCFILEFTNHYVCERRIFQLWVAKQAMGVAGTNKCMAYQIGESFMYM